MLPALSSTRRGDWPHLDRDLRRSRSRHAGGFRLFREVFGQVVRHYGELIGRDNNSMIGHHPYDCAPSLGRIPAADAAEKSVAAFAISRDRFLARSVGQALALSRQNRAENACKYE